MSCTADGRELFGAEGKAKEKRVASFETTRSQRPTDPGREARTVRGYSVTITRFT
jgi:hypothetical protein